MGKLNSDRIIENYISALLQQLKEGNSIIAITGEQSSGATYIFQNYSNNDRTH